MLYRGIRMARETGLKSNARAFLILYFKIVIQYLSFMQIHPVDGNSACWHKITRQFIIFRYEGK